MFFNWLNLQRSEQAKKLWLLKLRRHYICIL